MTAPVATPGQPCPTCGQVVRRATPGQPRGRKREAIAVELLRERTPQQVADLMGVSERTVLEYQRRALKPR